MMRIRFLGAAGTVTGSKYLVETDQARVLIDCGLFQGGKKLRERNWSALPIEPSSIDAVVLTHAHIDHTGYLPKLCAMGFRGRVYCTSGTRDLLQILLPDSGYLQEEAARHANKWRYSTHEPALPLYTREDADASLARLDAVEYHESFAPAPGVSARFTRAGHILGSGCLTVAVAGRTITFSGDVGRPVDPIMRPPEALLRSDYLVVESTYGDRTHPEEQVADVLAKLVCDTAEKKGTILVPAFAVGRAQHLLHLLAELRRAERIPPLPVFLDSPMAISATSIFCNHTDDHRLSEDECRALCAIPKYVRTPDESKAIDGRADAKIVISASGMATGGRILHHLRRFLPEERNAVLIVGYQAAGTRGRSLVDRAEELNIFGEYVRVRARVVQVQGLSAHADYAEMIAWLKKTPLSPKRVFVTHGEPAAASAFRRELAASFGWDAVVPEDEATFVLEP